MPNFSSDRKVAANQAKATKSIGSNNTTSTQPNETNHEQQGSLRVFPSRQSAVAIESTQQKETAVSREVEFTILPDGRMVDLIRSIRQPSNLEFLVWQDGSIRRTSQIEYDGELLVVPKMDPTVVSALRLPTTARPCPEIGELFVLMMNYIETYVDITTEYSFLVAAFVLTTWFADRLSVVPYLSICGPPESGKTTLLRLLHCLCRRAIHASVITPASLYRLTEVRPTFLIDEEDFGKDRASRDLQRLLRGGNRQGSRVLCNGRAFENFGPKVIASRVPQDDAALVSRNINIVMTPSAGDVQSFDLDAEEKVSDALQPMLQMFRFLHYARVSASQYPGFQKFPPRLRDNARALAATMLGNEELQQRLAGALESQVHSMQFDRFHEPEWVVMLALYGLYHGRNGDCYVHELTDETNRILRENGELRLYTPKKVGQILNQSLGFPTRRRGEGYRVELTLAGRKIHSQAKSMGIKRADILHWVSVESGLVGHPCSLCSEFGMMMDHEGERLLTFEEVAEEYKPCTSCGFHHHRQQCPRCNTPRKAEMRNPSGEPTSGA
jgi:hypothetical protein